MGQPRSASFRGRRFRITHVTGNMRGAVGLCDDDPQVRRIWLDTQQSRRDFLETVVHESLHALYPKLSERQVTVGARDLTRLLWRYGYRRRT